MPFEGYSPGLHRGSRSRALVNNGVAYVTIAQFHQLVCRVGLEGRGVMLDPSSRARRAQKERDLNSMNRGCSEWLRVSHGLLGS